MREKEFWGHFPAPINQKFFDTIRIVWTELGKVNLSQKLVMGAVKNVTTWSKGYITLTNTGCYL